MPATCPLHSLCDVAPGLVDERIEAFAPQLRAGSPAIDAGAPEDAPPGDLGGRARDGRPDLGAYEWWEPQAWLYLPVLIRGS
jgi:hypothetical protein